MASLDPAKFQFIAVDDSEDSKVVEEFLAKKKMAGWVGIDPAGRVVAWYGVKAFPTTIIVDAQGKIVESAYPAYLKAADLQAVADEKRRDNTASTEVVASASTEKPPVSTEKPLFEISLRKSTIQSPGESGMTGYPTGFEMHGWDAKSLVSSVYQLAADRIILDGSWPEGRYDLRAEFSSADDSVTTPMLQTAMSTGLHLRVAPKTVTKKAYVLKATAAGKTLLTPTASTGGSMWGNANGTLKLVNQSTEGLRAALENALDVPVVDEANIDEKFDAELAFPGKDADAARAALLKTLGLDLIQAERPIAMLEVSSRDETKKASEAKPQEAAQK